MYTEIISNIIPEYVNVLLIAGLIFCARIIDVSLGTMRIIFISKGKKYLAPILGFIEILVWLLAINQVMRTSSNVFYFVAYALGFALGNYFGIYLENKLALGSLVVRIITNEDTAELLKNLYKQDYGVTCLDGMGKHGHVRMIFTVIKRKDLRNVVSIIKKNIPDAFYSVDEAEIVSSGVFPMEHKRKRKRPFDFMRLARKGK